MRAHRGGRPVVPHAGHAENNHSALYMRPVPRHNAAIIERSPRDTPRAGRDVEIRGESLVDAEFADFESRMGRTSMEERPSTSQPYGITMHRGRHGFREHKGGGAATRSNHVRETGLQGSSLEGTPPAPNPAASMLPSPLRPGSGRQVIAVRGDGHVTSYGVRDPGRTDLAGCAPARRALWDEEAEADEEVVYVEERAASRDGAVWHEAQLAWEKESGVQGGADSPVHSPSPPEGSAGEGTWEGAPRPPQGPAKMAGGSSPVTHVVPTTTPVRRRPTPIAVSEYDAPGMTVRPLKSSASPEDHRPGTAGVARGIARAVSPSVPPPSDPPAIPRTVVSAGTFKSPRPLSFQQCLSSPRSPGSRAWFRSKVAESDLAGSVIGYQFRLPGLQGRAARVLAARERFGPDSKELAAAAAGGGMRGGALSARAARSLTLRTDESAFASSWQGNSLIRMETSKMYRLPVDRSISHRIRSTLRTRHGLRDLSLPSYDPSGLDFEQ